MEPDRRRHGALAEVGDVQVYDEPVRFDQVPEEASIWPRPGVALVVESKRHRVALLVVDHPLADPSVPVEWMRPVGDVRRKRDDPVRRRELAAGDPVDPGDERKAGCPTRVIGPREPSEHLLVVNREGEHGSSDVRSDHGACRVLLDDDQVGPPCFGAESATVSDAMTVRRSGGGPSSAGGDLDRHFRHAVLLGAGRRVQHRVARLRQGSHEAHHHASPNGQCDVRSRWPATSEDTPNPMPVMALTTARTAPS